MRKKRIRDGPRDLPPSFSFSCSTRGRRSNPTWNATLRFAVPATGAGSLHILLCAERAIGDGDDGEVHIQLSELLSGAPDSPIPAKFVSYQVRKISSGKPQGVLNLSYKLGEVTQSAGAANGYAPAQSTYTQAAAYPPPSAYPPPFGKADAYAPPAAAYPPAAKADAYPPPGGAYPPTVGMADAPATAYPPSSGYPPAVGKPAKAGEPVTAYPAASPSTAAPYAAPPPQYGGYGYPPPQAAGYGYQQQAVKPQKKKNNFGMGLGAGLLGGAVGGLLIGDMISDASAYDAGYDGGGFDGGFDF